MQMNGWSELGAMLGGGPALRQQAYQMGLEQGGRQSLLLEKARRARDENLARQAITPEAVTSAGSAVDPISGTPNDPSVAGTLISSLLRAGIDPRQLTGAQKDQQGIGFRNQAMAAATAANPDENLLNRVLMVISGKPTDLTKIQGNTVFNPTMTPQSQTVAPDQIGLAEMALRGAQSNAANAAAGEHSAHARLFDTQTAAGGFNPNVGAGAGANAKPTLPPVSDLAAVLGSEYDKGSGTTQVPREKVQQFLTWQARMAQTDPAYNNGSFALRQFAAMKPLGSGMNDSPDDVVPNPISLGGMVSAATGNGGTPAPAPVPAAPRKKAPTPGTTEGGFIFKGGDPSKQSNWVKASDLVTP